MTTTTVPPRPIFKKNQPLPPPGNRSKRQRHWIQPTVLYVLGALAVLNATAASVDYITASPLGDEGTLRASWGEVLLHLVPGSLFLLLGPLQFVSRLRLRFPRAHKIMGRAFVACGVITGFSSLLLSYSTLEYGGYLLYTANVTFGTLLLIMLVLAVSAVIRGDIVRHRAYMVRAFAIGLGAGTSRILMLPLFMLFGDMIGWTVGLGMWATWIINLTVAEVFVLKRFRLRGEDWS